MARLAIGGRLFYRLDDGLSEVEYPATSLAACNSQCRPWVSEAYGGTIYSQITRAIALICVATAISAHAQTFSLLYSFDGTDGNHPEGVVQGMDANFYGTTLLGGTANQGTFFEITPSGTLTTLQSFSGPNGSLPNGPVLLSEGTFYGTTSSTVYSIVPGGAAVTLASVNGSLAPLMQGADGNFYGTTAGDLQGGFPCGEQNGCGTIFEVTPTGTLTTLYAFPAYQGGNGPVPPFSPQAGLVQGSDGSFYGTTLYGGYPSCGLGSQGFCGTIFKITATGTFTLLYNFCAQTSCPDGFGPGGLVQGSDGNFYGTTMGGGGESCGTVFKITPSGTLTTLHVFEGTDGQAPSYGVVEGSDGNFYGTTSRGGSGFTNSCSGGAVSGYGTVFRMTPGGTVFILHDFDGTDGSNPNILTIANGGIIYGTTAADGADSDGTVFSLSGGMGGTSPSTTSLGLLPSTVAVGSTGPVVMTATIAPASGSGTPTGEVDFFNGSNQIVGVGDLSGGIATLSYNPSGLAVGAYQFTAVYSGDSVFSASTSSAGTLTISSSPSAATPSLSPASGTYFATQSVTITDTTPGAAIYYTTDGTTPTTDSAIYSATITVDSSETIKAIAAAGGYSNSAVASATYTINLSPDYQVSVTPSTLSIAAGQSGTATFTVTPMNGFDSQVSFTCSGLPAEATCTFNPSSVTPTGGKLLTSTLTVTTTAATAELLMPRSFVVHPFCALLIPFVGIIVGLAPRWRPRLRAILLNALAAVLLSGLISCGGSSSNPPPNSGTPPGTSSVAVTASTSGSGAISHSTTLTITIAQ